ncbi:MAG: energy transducer TonB [Paludibacter sp.]|nr:energy transducer TonB [Bacteroidales bacterium]MCM1442583.1 energy transducer TonB [Muribaculum sp.]MCM1481428.1 energy transducer TonB [Paludibacter sp.]
MKAYYFACMSACLILLGCTKAADKTVAADNADSTIVVATEQSEPILMVCETMPEFPGGQIALFQYLSSMLSYPDSASRAGIEGRVVCSFVIGKDGDVQDAAIAQSSGNQELDAEALRVVATMPDWSPGMQDGKPVRVSFALPVDFRLN